jgi:MarR family transcriptional regulator, organic hydroperoxide resistance regulator
VGGVPREVTDATVFEDAWSELIDALKRARGRNEPERNGGLTLAQYYLLEPLLKDETARMTGLATKAGVSKPVATRMIARLGEQGFVSREVDPTDARAVTIRLTAAGKRAVATKGAFVESKRHALAEALDPEEREQAAGLLRRLAGVIDEL